MVASLAYAEIGDSLEKFLDNKVLQTFLLKNRDSIGWIEFLTERFFPESTSVKHGFSRGRKKY